MSKLSRSLLSGTSKNTEQLACLVLEDGTCFDGVACAAQGEVFGEICFNTGLEGYLEVITDPSYAGQIVTMTYPQIGNYGVSMDDIQSAVPYLRGFVVRDLCSQPSNWRCEKSLGEYLTEQGVVAIEGIDTRALVRHVRDNGAMRAVLSTVDLDHDSLLEKVRGCESLNGVNHVAQVSRASVDAYEYEHYHEFAVAQPADPRYCVVAYDCGAKKSILDNLVRVGCEVTEVPWNTPAQDVLDMNPDGVFLSNGPGDPDAVTETYAQVENLLGKVPMFGICLGHQMLGKAAGASIEKLKFGHRGANQPVMNLLSGRVEISVQNHGYGVLFDSLGPLDPDFSGGISEHPSDLREWVGAKVAPVVINDRYGRIQLTHVNLNDGTIEGLRFLDVPAFSVQYHPEAAPGSTDSHYLFTAFTKLMDGDPDYLNIDIAQDRLNGWEFCAAPVKAGEQAGGDANA